VHHIICTNESTSQIYSFESPGVIRIMIILLVRNI